MMPTHLTFIDIETTAVAGPDADTDAIIEIAAARVELATRKTVDEWSTLVRPPRLHVSFPIWVLGDFHAGRYDGVDWQRDGITIAQALADLSGRFLTPGATIAGQNPSFDLRYLKRDWRAREQLAAYRFDLTNLGPWPALDYHVIDLVSPAFLLAMTGAIPGCSLRHTAPLAGRGPQRHRALDDVLDAIAVFWLLADMMAAGAQARDLRGGR